MTDLEMTKLCADAMGLEVRLEGQNWNMRPNTMGWQLSYDPLHNDAQAMALVRRLKLRIGADVNRDSWWFVSDIENRCGFQGPDLNRAICECVAQMRSHQERAQG